MRNKILFFIFSILIAFSVFAFSTFSSQQKEKDKAKKTIPVIKKNEKIFKENKNDSVAIPVKNYTTQVLDSIKKSQEIKNVTLHKKNAHASYYHSKFNGRRTANGEIFDNNKYTAAHKKLPFGTILKVTNEVNGNYVIVKVNDRGPFTKSRDIDLSRKAFMELVDNKNSGSVMVTIEVIEE